MKPHLAKEIALLKQGYCAIAGLDEAGRGAWAGPVVAAAVILPLDQLDLSDRLMGVNDSKKLAPRQREQFFDLISKIASTTAVGSVPADVIDKINILVATRQAMREAITELKIEPDYLLLDYVRLSTLNLPQDAFSKADSISLTVAAASIIAKVTRDRLMIQLDEQYPGYGFSQHKGYGTKAHQAAIAKLGPSPVHRLSFKPLHKFNSRLQFWGNL
jgi:ribonuclease HII